MEKKCSKCGKVKPLDVFYKGYSPEQDGYSSSCKECTKSAMRKNYEKRSQDPEWIEKQRERGREKYHRLYKGKAYNGSVEAKKRWAERNTIKRAAHLVVSNAIRDGRMEKKPCEKCGDEAVAHHEDYTKPYEVTWLCVKHHNKRHVELRGIDLYGR